MRQCCLNLWKMWVMESPVTRKEWLFLTVEFHTHREKINMCVCVKVPRVLLEAVSIPSPGYAGGLRAAFPSSQRKGCDSS